MVDKKKLKVIREPRPDLEQDQFNHYMKVQAALLGYKIKYKRQEEYETFIRKDIKEVADTINRAYKKMEAFQPFKTNTQKQIDTFYRRWIVDGRKLLKDDITIRRSSLLTGLLDIQNLVMASGGSEQESIKNAREAAPGNMQSLNRVVSPEDFENLANTVPGFSKQISSSLIELYNLTCAAIAHFMPDYFKQKKKLTTEIKLRNTTIKEKHFKYYDPKLFKSFQPIFKNLP